MVYRHLITREIGIDMGHRVTHHGSKCRNLHGHRYTIQAICKGPLHTLGPQEGMVLDFGFLKEEMMQTIDAYCDHGMCLWKEDPWLPRFVTLSQREVLNHTERDYWFTDDSSFGKLYVVPFVPTAENLAEHWFSRLRDQILIRSEDRAQLIKVKVWETPNCSAEYPFND